jgi:uncharacterized RDD family membrane protein YckC
MMFCSRCGTWLADDAPICPLCGLVLRPGAVASTPGPASGMAPRQGAAIIEQVAYAGFWRRCVGLLIDVVVTYFPIATVRVLLGLPASGSFDPLLPSAWWAALFELLIDWLYASILISSPWRATLGQAVMDLHVTDLDGNRISFARASARYLAQLLNLVTVGFGLILQVFSARRQALHDLVSGTVVVRSRHAGRVVEAPVMRLVP